MSCRSTIWKKYANEIFPPTTSSSLDRPVHFAQYDIKLTMLTKPLHDYVINARFGKIIMSLK